MIHTVILALRISWVYRFRTLHRIIWNNWMPRLSFLASRFEVNYLRHYARNIITFIYIYFFVQKEISQMVLALYALTIATMKHCVKSIIFVAKCVHKLFCYNCMSCLEYTSYNSLLTYVTHAIVFLNGPNTKLSFLFSFPARLL